VHFKYLANSLALVYNFCSPVYNIRELAEGYDWKSVVFPFLLSCFLVLCSMFACGQAKVQVWGCDVNVKYVHKVP
jgi:hypothetical protein